MYNVQCTMNEQPLGCWIDNSVGLGQDFACVDYLSAIGCYGFFLNVQLAMYNVQCTMNEKSKIFGLIMLCVWFRSLLVLVVFVLLVAMDKAISFIYVS